MEEPSGGSRESGRRPIIIRIVGLTKTFGSAAAVQDLSLDLLQGEFFCLLGPSGCGKSTLLRLLAGFEQADRGVIELDGRDLTRVPPHRRPLNMMFQSYALFPHMTVVGNIGYGLKSEALGPAERKARLEEALGLLGLEGLEGRYPAQLSGGQKQRVALARALAKRPRVLLLDEPLGALDRALRERMQGELKRLQTALGLTFVVVTHDQDEAMAMSDRIGVMQAGRLVQVDRPRALYERPSTRFVAEFLGDANLLGGTVTNAAADSARVRLANGIEIAAIASQKVEAGQEVAVAVRPEQVEFAAASAEGRPNELAGRIQDMAYLGSETAWGVLLSTGDAIRVTRTNARPASALDPEPGDQVMVRFASDAAVVLP